MRTLIWSSTAVVLLVTGALFTIARHAARQPDSLVGRCALAAYHVWDPTPLRCEAPVQQAAIVPQTPAPAQLPVGKFTPDLEAVEPIVVEATEQEPPLAFPRLSPEIAAALERLRGEEESEAPPQPFDGSTVAPRMPYADEEAAVESLPYPDVATEDDSETDTDLPGTTGFFFLPPAFWQKVCDHVMDSLGRTTDATPGDEEPADEGTGEDDSVDLNELVPYHHYHENSCPYSGACPSGSYYRTMQPIAPAASRK